MNITVQLERLADDLEAAGHDFAAAEIRHESWAMRGRLLDLDRVLNNHKVAIAVTLEEKHQAVGFCVTSGAASR